MSCRFEWDCWIWDWICASGCKLDTSPSWRPLKRDLMTTPGVSQVAKLKFPELWSLSNIPVCRLYWGCLLLCISELWRRSGGMEKPWLWDLMSRALLSSPSNSLVHVSDCARWPCRSEAVPCLCLSPAHHQRLRLTPGISLLCVI